MRPCPDENRLVRWVAGELDAAQEDELLRHVAECAACRSRRDGILRVWAVLDEARVEPPDGSIAEAVLRAAREPTSDPLRPGRLFTWRLAAAVALAAGLGMAAGRLTPLAAPQAVRVSADEVVDRTGIDALAGRDSVLAHLFEVEPDREPSPEEET